MSEKLFCGKRRDTIPPGYSGYDTEYNCLRRGVGVGLYIARNGRAPRRSSDSKKTSSLFSWWVILLIILLILLVVVIIIILVWKRSSS